MSTHTQSVRAQKCDLFDRLPSRFLCRLLRIWGKEELSAYLLMTDCAFMIESNINCFASSEVAEPEK